MTKIKAPPTLAYINNILSSAFYLSDLGAARWKLGQIYSSYWFWFFPQIKIVPRKFELPVFESFLFNWEFGARKWRTTDMEIRECLSLRFSFCFLIKKLTEADPKFHHANSKQND